MDAGFAVPVGVNLVGILWRRELTGQVAANQRDLDLERLGNPRAQLYRIGPVNVAFLRSRCQTQLAADTYHPPIEFSHGDGRQ